MQCTRGVTLPHAVFELFPFDHHFYSIKCLSAIQLCHLKLLPDNKILDWSKLKQIADNILKCI